MILRSWGQNNFLNFFDRAKQTNSIATWAGDWCQLGKADGNPEALTQSATTYGLTPLIEVTSLCIGLEI